MIYDSLFQLYSSLSLLSIEEGTAGADSLLCVCVFMLECVCYVFVLYVVRFYHICPLDFLKFDSPPLERARTHRLTATMTCSYLQAVLPLL